MENESHALHDEQAGRLATQLHQHDVVAHSLLTDLSNITPQSTRPASSSQKIFSRSSSDENRSVKQWRYQEFHHHPGGSRQSRAFSEVARPTLVTSGTTSYFDGPNDEISEARDTNYYASQLECPNFLGDVNEGETSIQLGPFRLPSQEPALASRVVAMRKLDLSSLDAWAYGHTVDSTIGKRGSRVNYRLRPSQRPVAPFAGLDRTRRMDRFASLRRDPAVSREIFLFSRPAHSTKKPRNPRRRGGPALSGRLGSTIASNPRIQDQNSRRVSTPLSPTVVTIQFDSGSRDNRQPSRGSIWRVGGGAPSAQEPQGRDIFHRSPHSHSRPQTYVSRFLRNSTIEDDSEMHRKRLALALDVNHSQRVLLSPSCSPVEPIRSIPLLPAYFHGCPQSPNSPSDTIGKLIWRDNEWMREDRTALLEAPHLRDDFYCSVLAYSHRLDRLAVALGCNIYLWSESTGVINTPPTLDSLQDRSAYVTSIAFSSEAGGRAILAVGRADGRVVLWSPLDEEPRYLKTRSPKAAAHLSFRPTFVRRPSQRHPSLMAENEVLLMGDDTGLISVYFVEWPEATKRFLFGWHGSLCLHARISVHTQQICGIAWSQSGDYFATGGNDNLCCLFQTNTILAGDNRSYAPAIDIQRDARGDPHLSVLAGVVEEEMLVQQDKVKHQWRLNAAIKAIAFCPWQRGLLAAGGGSNDRCIHFFHTMSGASLAAIDCAAQVTSLIWSETRREIAATFGFAQPEHPYRVAVYSWPSCQEVVAIPWVNEMRALHAIGYPGKPKRERGQKSGGTWGLCNREEGCLVVAGSDGSIKFHEIWSEARSTTAPRRGLLGGSDILESLHGIEKEGKDTIR